MTNPTSLLDRLDAIGRSLSATEGALALIGMGSVGRELDRLDEFSDLDFFAIVAEGYKDAFMADLDWLARVAPLAYAFRNTPDGYKLLYADGIFCEFAVLTPAELENAAYAPGRLVWGHNDFDATLVVPRHWSPPKRPVDPDWLLGEALTNLYVGLCRFNRGEKLSAFRFIQGYAVDRLIDLSRIIVPGDDSGADPFDGPRRFEQRFPILAAELPSMMQGYDRSRESAIAILDLLDSHFRVDPAIKTAILAQYNAG